MGTCVHSSFGEIGFGSACVYLFGMTPPSSKSGEVSVSPGPGGPPFPCAKAEPKLAAKNIAPTASFLMNVSSLECNSISRRRRELRGPCYDRAQWQRKGQNLWQPREKRRR